MHLTHRTQIAETYDQTGNMFLIETSTYTQGRDTIRTIFVHLLITRQGQNVTALNFVLTVLWSSYCAQQPAYRSAG